MKKANSSGTNCTTRRYAEVPSPRLLEPPAKTSRDPEKQFILFGPKILFKDFDRMSDTRIYDLESSLAKSLKARRLHQSRLDQKRTTTPTPTPPRKGTSFGEARSLRLPQNTGGTLRRIHCAGAWAGQGILENTPALSPIPTPPGDWTRGRLSRHARAAKLHPARPRLLSRAEARRP